MRDKQPVWVILRADMFQGREAKPSSLVTAKAVVRSGEFAKSEVERLNSLHPDGSIVYWCHVSRLIEPEVKGLCT
jgi:hypothetical protein